MEVREVVTSYVVTAWEWRARHRFPLEKALELAREMAPKVQVNGLTTLECIEQHRRRRD